MALSNGNAFNRGVIFMAGKGLNLLSEQVRHLTEVVITPEHADRTESAEFRHDKEKSWHLLGGNEKN